MTPLLLYNYYRSLSRTGSWRVTESVPNSEASFPTEPARQKHTLFGKHFEYTGEHLQRFTRSA